MDTALEQRINSVTIKSIASRNLQLRPLTGMFLSLLLKFDIQKYSLKYYRLLFIGYVKTLIYQVMPRHLTVPEIRSQSGPGESRLNNVRFLVDTGVLISP